MYVNHQVQNHFKYSQYCFEVTVSLKERYYFTDSKKSTKFQYSKNINPVVINALVIITRSRLITI